MKNTTLFLGIVSLLLLGGCSDPVDGGLIISLSETSTSEEGTSGSEHSGSGTESSSSSSSSSESSSSEETHDENGVAFIGLIDKEIILQLGKNESYYPIVYFFDENGADISDSLTLDQRGVSFASSNESIITVNAVTGKPTQVALGNAYIVCTTDNGKHQAKCLVHVVSDKNNLHREYQKVEQNNLSSLKAGDVLVFGNSEQGKTMTDQVSAGDLHATNSTFSGNKITSLGANTAEFMLDGSSMNWTLEIDTETESGRFTNKYLTAFNLNRVGFVNKTGNIHWEIFVDEDNDLRIQSTSEVRGWMMYNMDTDAYTLYESNVTQRMKMPEIYRLTLVIS